MVTRPTYTDGYAIRYNRETDQFECWQDDTLLSKKDKKPAYYKSEALAVKFMAACGAQIAAPKPAYVWTPPTSVVIAPLSEQLARIADDAPRFVVVEQYYSATYHEQGYAVYDRQAQAIVCPTTYHGRNFATESRDEAEKEVAYLLENPPVSSAATDYSDEFLALLGDDDEIAERQSKIEHSSSIPVAQEHIVILDGPYEVGVIVSDEYDRQYHVTEQSYWLSESDVADLEDQDIFEQSGWHTKASLVTKEGK